MGADGSDKRPKRLTTTPRETCTEAKGKAMEGKGAPLLRDLIHCYEPERKLTYALFMQLCFHDVLWWLFVCNVFK